MSQARQDDEPLVEAFARANRPPKDPEELGQAMLDVVRMAKACNREAESWTMLRVSMPWRGRAEKYPGSFLSNPAFLLSSESQWGESGQKSMGSHGPGCFFSYAHFQESTTGPALLMAAYAPRRKKPARGAQDYARALAWLRDQGLVESASWMAGGVEALDQIARGEVEESELSIGFPGFELSAKHIEGLGGLRRDASMRAIELALSGKDRASLTLFSREAIERLGWLVSERKRLIEVRELEREARSDEVPKSKAARL